MNKSCQIWMSHVTCEWGVSHVSESCLIHRQTKPSATNKPYGEIQKFCDTWINHVKYAWGMTNASKSCHTWESHVTCKRVVFHTQADKLSAANEPCQIWMNHDTRQRVMSHVNESCHMCILHVICHLLIRHGTREWAMSNMNESWHTPTSHGRQAECQSCAVCTHTNDIWQWHGTNTCDMPRSCVSCFIHVCHDVFANDIWHGVRTCDMTRSHVSWHDGARGLSLYTEKYGEIMWHRISLYGLFVTYLYIYIHQCMHPYKYIYICMCVQK